VELSAYEHQQVNFISNSLCSTSITSQMAQAGSNIVSNRRRWGNCGQNGGISIQSRPSGVNAIPHHRVPGRCFTHNIGLKLNRKHNTWIKQTTVCNRRSYSHQALKQLVARYCPGRNFYICAGVSIVPHIDAFSIGGKHEV